MSENDSPPPYNDGMYNNNYHSSEGIYSNTNEYNNFNSYPSSNDPISGTSTYTVDPNSIYTVVQTTPPNGQRPFFGFIYLEDGILKSPVKPAERRRAYFLLFLCLLVLPGLFIAYLVYRFMTTPNLKIVWFAQIADVALAAQTSYFSFIGQVVGVSILSQVSGFSYVSMVSIFSCYSMVSAVSCGSLFSFFSLHPQNGVCLWRIRNSYYWN
jgi:hypothetical protein